MLKFGNNQNKNKNNKKGYLRTLEAMLAFILTFSFLIFLYSDSFIQKDEISEKLVLETLRYDDNFRNSIFQIVGKCVYNTDSDLIVNITREIVTSNFAICNEAKPTLPKTSVFVEKIVIAGNTTVLLNNPLVKLYMWE